MIPVTRKGRGVMAPEIKEFKTLVNRAIKPIDTIAEMQYVEKALEKVHASVWKAYDEAFPEEDSELDNYFLDILEVLEKTLGSLRVRMEERLSMIA